MDLDDRRNKPYGEWYSDRSPLTLEKLRGARSKYDCHSDTRHEADVRPSIYYYTLDNKYGNTNLYRSVFILWCEKSAQDLIYKVSSLSSERRSALNDVAMWNVATISNNLNASIDKKIPLKAGNRWFLAM